MTEQLIYTDNCLETTEQEIASKTGALIVKRLSEDTWTVNDTLRIVTNPFLVLAVINRLDATSLMEISLLHFMCKPILVTTNSINVYPTVVRTTDHIDCRCNLMVPNNTFISWFTHWKGDNLWK